MRMGSGEGFTRRNLNTLKLGRDAARMNEDRSALKILTNKLTGERPLGNPRRTSGQ